MQMYHNKICLQGTTWVGRYAYTSKLMFIVVMYPFVLDPLLVYEKAEMGEDGFEGALDLFPEIFDPKKIQPEFSGTIDDGVCVCMHVCMCECLCMLREHEGYTQN